MSNHFRIGACARARTRTRTRALLAAAAALPVLAAGPAAAASFNVSQLVTGVAQGWPLYLPGSPAAVPCGSDCQYVTTSVTGMSNSYTQTPAPYTAGAWPPVYAGSQPGVAAVSEALAVALPPAGQVLDGDSLGVQQASEVRFDSLLLLNTVRRIAVQSWKTGSGASGVSHGLRINTPAAGPKRTYLEFRVPALLTAWVVPKKLGGPSGFEWVYTEAERLQTRAAVDVYVDGLPVWSSAVHQLQPQRWGADLNPLRVAWGQPLADDLVTLYLGQLPAGSSRTVAVVMRVESRIDAPDCVSAASYGTTYRRCYALREGMTLPAKSVVVSGPYSYIAHKPDLQVYTR